MVNKFETIGILLSIGVMALALFLLNGNVGSRVFEEAGTQSAAVAVSENNASSIVNTLSEGSQNGIVQKLIADDIVFGEGDPVVEGDTVSVQYIGTLQNGQQFDNSYLKGVPFEFTVGAGSVIKGWDQGIVGMKVGGQRILVIPPELAYGSKGVGPIPGNATLVFAIELLEIK